MYLLLQCVTDTKSTDNNVGKVFNTSLSYDPEKLPVWLFLVWSPHEGGVTLSVQQDYSHVLGGHSMEGQGATPSMAELPKEGVFTVQMINFKNKLPMAFDRRSIAGNFRSLTST